MADVTARLARPIGFDSFADLEVEPTAIRSNADGTLTVEVPDDVPAATLALIEERMTTRDDTEVPLRRAILAALATDDAYLARTSPTAAQNTAQIKALTQQMQAAIRLLASQD